MSHKANDIYYENLAELSQEGEHLKLSRYNNQLRTVWLNMVKNYPYYDIVDYIEACNKAGLLVF